MADSTSIGRQGKQTILELFAAAHDYPSVIKMQMVTSGGTITDEYLWIDGAGRLRIHTSMPSDQDSDGTIVGTQS